VTFKDVSVGDLVYINNEPCLILEASVHSYSQKLCAYVYYLEEQLIEWEYLQELDMYDDYWFPVNLKKINETDKIEAG